MREYKTEVVDEKTIRDLIEAAVLSPNAVNQQPRWRARGHRRGGLPPGCGPGDRFTRRNARRGGSCARRHSRPDAVGSEDPQLRNRNTYAMRAMPCETSLTVVPGAGTFVQRGGSAGPCDSGGDGMV